MINRILLLVVLNIAINGNAQVNELWNKRYNGSGNGIDQPVDFIIDVNGNTFITGYTHNGSNFDVVTLKYNDTGTLLWSNTYGGAGLDEPSALALDNNGDVIIVGSKYISGSDWDIFTLKLNGITGVQSWQTTHSGSNLYDKGNDVTIDASNNILVVGSYYVTATNLDYILLKYNTSGLFQWSNTGGSVLTDEGLLVEVDASGNSYISGSSEFSISTTFIDFSIIKINSSGTTVWSIYEDSGFGKIDVPKVMKLDGLGNVYVGGSGFTTTTNLEDYMLVKVSNLGIVNWKRLHSGNGQANDIINGIDIHPSNNEVYITGKLSSISTAEDFKTIAYSAAGVELWATTYSSVGNTLDEATDLKYSNNSIYVTGYSYKIGENNNYTTIKYDLSGQEIWEKSFNYSSNQSDKAFKMAIDLQDNILVTGSSYTSSTNNLDIATIKYCQLETTATVDTSVCIGNSINLTANAIGGFNYTWSVVSGTPITSATLSCTSCQSPTATPNVTTVYAVSAENAIGCIDFDTVIVVVNIPSTPTISAFPSSSFCSGNSTILSVNNENYMSYSWNSGGTDSTKAISTAGTQTVTITDTNNCQSSNSIITIVYNLPTVNAGINDSICEGFNFQLQATGAATYLWNSNTTLSQYIISNPIATPTTTQIYTVTGTDLNGCQNSDNITITVNSNPIVTVSSDATICVGDSIQLIANGASTYQWNNTGSLSNGTINNPYASPIQLTNYTVTGTNSFGCTDQALVIISTNSLPFISAGVDQTICENDSAHIFTTGGSIYIWQYTADLSSLVSSNPWASPTTSSTYYVKGIDANGCSNYDTVIVNVNTLPNVNAGNDTSICLLTSGTLNATGALSYVWNPSSTLTGINLATPTVSPTITTTYTVNGTNANGCSNTDQITVSIFSLPNISAGIDFSICYGDSATLSPSGGISYLWDYSTTLSNINLTNPYASPTTPTTYSVTGTDANGCKNQNQVTVSIYQLPNIFAGNDLTICENESAQLLASGGSSYVWDSNSHLSNINIHDPSAVSLTNTTWFYVTGTDNNNCRNRDSVKVFVNQLPSPPVLTSIFPNLISSYVYGNTWYFNSGIEPSLTNDTIDYVNQILIGPYFITHTDFNGCTSLPSNTILITTLLDTTLSVNGFKTISNPIYIYPNPTTNQLFIELPIDIDELYLSDLNGKIIIYETKLFKGTTELFLDDLERGVYIITFINKNQTKSLKIIKQ